MAKERKEKKESLKELPDQFIPVFSAAMPEWSKQISADLIKDANLKGSPGFEPGPEQAQQVEQMTALGMSSLDISAILRIEPRLLEKFYKYEIETSTSRINNQVAKIALQMAMSGTLPDMTKFWLKSRAGWKETKVTEITGANGGPVEFAEVKRRMIEAVESEIIDADVIEDKDNEQAIRP